MARRSSEREAEALKRKYTEAPKVLEMVNTVIKEIKEHGHLANARIECVFVLKTPKNKGKELWGKARKVSGLQAYLFAKALGFDTETEMPEDFFVIEISKPIWDLLEVPQRRALVDHELSHCWRDEEGKISILPHDLEEFNGVVARNGLWRQDVERFLKAAKGKQMPLPLKREKPGKTIQPSV
jgi:hypothetical protein